MGMRKKILMTLSEFASSTDGRSSIAGCAGLGAVRLGGPGRTALHGGLQCEVLRA
jgi:hypothetical protein